MDRTLKLKLAAGAAGGLAVAGAGGAIAATQTTSPKAESQAIVDDAAHRLGVTSTALESALKKAVEDRIDAAVAAGRLTRQEGDAIKKQISSGAFPALAAPLMFGLKTIGPGPGLGTAASYLGLNSTQLRSKLESGKSLAQVATAQGKSVNGLVAALVADARTQLDAAVKAGRLSKSQESEMLSGLERRISSFVHGRPPVFETQPRFPGPPPEGVFG